MSTTATIRNLNTRNPNLPVYRAADAALKGAVFAYDMLTYSDSTTLTDITGNGRDAVFNSAPTTNADGTVFDGTVYADCAAGTSAFYDNFTAWALIKHTAGAGSYVALSQRDAPSNTGFELFTLAGWTPRAYVGFSSNPTTAQGTEGGHTNTPNGQWSVALCKMVNGHGYVEQLETGSVTVARLYRNDTIGAKAWRIGAGYDTADAARLIFRNATIGHIGLIDGVTTRAQDVALLAYLTDIVEARGGTL